MFRFLTDRGDEGRRLDQALVRRLVGERHVSRTRIQTLICAGDVRVNGAVAVKPSTRLAPGDELEVTLSIARARREHSPEDIPLSVLFEDDHLLIIDKPAGLVAHPTARYPRGTLVNALLWRAARDNWRERPSLVHRLDKLTSGVLIVAKSKATHAALARAMRARAVEKDYLAVVYGTTPVRKGSISFRIAVNADQPGRVTTSKLVGRESVTMFEELGRSSDARAGLTLVRCRLMTGRLHQIRAHLAASGLPVVGDPLYGAPRWKGIRDEELARVAREFPRQALHSWRLGFSHPVTRERIEIEAPIPGDLAELLDGAGLRACQT